MILFSEKNKCALLLFFIILFSFSYAQKDTLYLSKEWKKTTKDSADYYSVCTPKDKGYYCKTFTIKNIIQKEGLYSSLRPDIKEGKFLSYSDDGEIIEEANYKNDKLHGELILYQGNKNIWRKANYKEGLLHGELLMYHKSGIMKRKEIYENDRMIYGNCYSTTGKDTLYFPMEEMAEFRGGQQALMEYLQKNIHYPKEAKKNKIKGRVIVSFVVTKEGKIEEVRAQKSVHPLLDEEAIRVVKNMPKWKPGRQDGNPVNVHFNLPINFNI